MEGSTVDCFGVEHVVLPEEPGCCDQHYFDPSDDYPAGAYSLVSCQTIASFVQFSLFSLENQPVLIFIIYFASFRPSNMIRVFSISQRHSLNKVQHSSSSCSLLPIGVR